MSLHAERNPDSFRNLLSVIRGAEYHRIRKILLGTVVGGIGVSTFILAAFACAAVLLGLPASVRYLLWAAIAGIVLRYFIKIIRTIRPRDPAVIAADLENRDESLSGNIRTAVELSGYAPRGTSSYLIRHHVRRSAALLLATGPARLLSSTIRVPWKLALLGAVALAFLWVSSAGVPLAWLRATVPHLDPPPPPAAWESVAPGDTSIAEGGSLEIRAVLRHGSDTPHCVIRRAGRPNRTDHLKRRWSTPPRTVYTNRIERIEEPFMYRVAADSDTSAWYAVDVFSPLRFTRATTRYRYPAYTGMDAYETPEMPDVLMAVEGTEVTVTMSANNELIRCMVQYGNGHITDSLVISGGNAIWPIRLRERRHASITATDSWNQTVRTGPVDIRPLPDLAPLIHDVAPGRDITLDKDMMVDVTVHASDDYGLSSVSIAYAYEGKEGSVPIAEGTLGREGTWSKTWFLGDLDLYPEDVITYRLVVTDNNTLTGPRSSMSRWYHLRFPSLEEIIARIEGREDDMVDSLHTVSDEARSIHEELKELSMELAGEENADWMTRESLKSLADRQQELGERLGRIAEELSTIEKQTEEAELVPAELLEKVTRVRELIVELDMPELKNALEDLQEAMENVDQREMRRSLAELSRHQEKIMDSLDRATEFLEQLLTAKELSHLAREAERLAMEHETVMESADAQTAGERGETEQRLSEDLGTLEEAGEETIESLAKLSEEAAESLAAAMKRQKQAGTREALESAGENLKSGRSEAAIPHQEQALDGLQRLSADLQSIESKLGQEDSRRMQEALRRAESVIAELSLEQELLNERSENTSMPSARQVGIADALRELRRNLEELFGPGMSTASGALLELMAKAQNQIDAAVTGMHTPSRLKQGRRSLSALNSVSAAIASTRNQMNSSSSCPSGMPTEDMFGLSQQQSGLNSMCQSMLPGADQLSPEALSAMAARQQWIRDQLARLSAEPGGNGLLGSMGEIGREMEEVIEELRTKGLDRNTLDTQRRILSRMLDAQRSIRRQGLARRRRSRPAEEQTMQRIPGDLNAPPEPTPGMAPPPRLDDRYPPMYQALIDAYFRAIQRTGGMTAEP